MPRLRPEELDPEIRRAIADLPAFVFSADTVPMMRQNAVFAPVPAPDIERVELTTQPGVEVSLSVLRPHNAVGDLPALYWMHGGGMVIGNRHMDDARLNEWCRSLSCACVSVEYRLAPDAAYPAPLDDCDAGLGYLFDHADQLRIDPARVGVGGRSAGGALAAALALRWRGRERHSVAFQYLEYPMLDDRGQTPSSKVDGLPVWSCESNEFGWRSYLGPAYGTADVPADAAPARAAELAGLPPTFISVGTVDCLRDESIDYAALVPGRRINRVARICRCGARLRHVADCAVAKCAARDSVDWLARQLN